MAKMPGTLWAGEHGSKKMARYDVVCVHTIVGRAPAHAAHFSTSMDGAIFQSRDTGFQSAANLNGNHRIIAIENADMPPTWPTNDGHAVPAFSAQQCESIAQICAWAHETHGIPLVRCPDSKPGSRGIAWHRLGIDGNFGSYKYPGRVEGGELWSSSTGKVCPGDRRIDQVIEVIIPRAVEIVGGATPGDDMTPTEMANAIKINEGGLRDQLASVVKDVVSYLRSEGVTGAADGAASTVDDAVIAKLTPVLNEIKSALGGGTPGAISDADVERIAQRVIEKIAD